MRTPTNKLLTMNKYVQLRILLFVALTVIVLVWNTRDEKGRRTEIGAAGAVVVEGDGESLLADQYRVAADLVGMGKLLEAENLYMELMKQESRSPDAYVGLATCRAMRNDPVSARQLYNKALGLAPKSINALIGLGSSYMDESDYTNAAANYEAAHALNKDSPEVHWGLTVAYAGMGRQAQARNHLDRFKKLAPDSRHISALEDIVGQSLGQQ